MENQFEDDNVMGYQSDRYDDGEFSDSESVIISVGDSGDGIGGIVEDDLVKLCEYDPFFRMVNISFMSRLGDLSNVTTIVDIRRKNWLSSFGQARLRCFEIFAELLRNKGDNSKFVKFAWYGGSKQEIARIMSHGFGHRDVRDNDGVHGQGICLSSGNFPAQSVKTCLVDEDGLRHVLLCRVILGNTEFVDGDSSQYNSSVDEFDSESVDGVRSPRNYVIWSNKMNTHILPEFVISFRAPYSLKGYSKTGNILRKQPSPWMPISSLIFELSKYLPSQTMNLIRKHHNNLKDKRLTRRELVKKVRGLVDNDVLLITIIKSFQPKKFLRNEDQASAGVSACNCDHDFPFEFSNKI